MATDSTANSTAPIGYYADVANLDSTDFPLTFYVVDSSGAQVSTEIYGNGVNQQLNANTPPTGYGQVSVSMPTTSSKPTSVSTVVVLTTGVCPVFNPGTQRTIRITVRNFPITEGRSDDNDHGNHGGHGHHGNE
ncbi:MAG TPA: hypothetical protein VHI13_19195 [Candidatus Kapabacteria bacterium]|nr:hypothetical protein [Candidatus Kapabacteria bacterium]